jgi:hypothetical protein
VFEESRRCTGGETGWEVVANGVEVKDAAAPVRDRNTHYIAALKRLVAGGKDNTALFSPDLAAIKRERVRPSAIVTKPQLNSVRYHRIFPGPGMLIPNRLTPIITIIASP